MVVAGGEATLDDLSLRYSYIKGFGRGSRRSKIFHFFQNVGLTSAPQAGSRASAALLRLAEQGFVVVLPSYRCGILLLDVGAP